jgi:hypothetical protein
MRREGYLIVDRLHPLFPREVGIEIELAAKSILQKISSSYNVALPAVRFEVTSANVRDGKPAKALRNLFSRGIYPDVRLIYSEKQVDAQTVNYIFCDVELLVMVHEAQGGAPIGIREGISPEIPRILISRGRSNRLVEDLIVEISLSNFFRGTSAIGSLVDQEGLRGFFREKARFARQRAGPVWLNAPSAKARYAVLTALNSCADHELEERAEAAYIAWREFAEWVTIRRPRKRYVPTDRPVARRGRGDPASSVDRKPLSLVPKIGRQMPLARIGKITRALPLGEYTMAILRRASEVRKSPELRDDVTAIFGPGARINSFRVFFENVYINIQKPLDRLVMSGHVVLMKIRVERKGVTIMSSD